MSRNKKTYKKIREILKGIISNMGSVILILALCTIVIAIILNWESAVAEMQRFIKVIMPFIFGFGIFDQSIGGKCAKDIRQVIFQNKIQESL